MIFNKILGNINELDNLENIHLEKIYISSDEIIIMNME